MFFFCDLSWFCHVLLVCVHFQDTIFQSCDITFKFVKTDFQDIKELRKTTSKRMEGIFRMDVVRPILFSFAFPCSVENIWSVGEGLSRRALFWASEPKRRVRWLAAVKTLYHWSAGEIPGAGTRHVMYHPGKNSRAIQKRYKSPPILYKTIASQLSSGVDDWMRWPDQNKRQGNEPGFSCLPPMIIG